MKTISLLMIMSLFVACSPKVATTVFKNYGPLDSSEQVFLLGLEDAVPESTEILGEINLAGKGATGTYEGVINKAKAEAQKIGGNAIKITEHKAPSLSGSSGHQIHAQILKVADVSKIQQDDQIIRDVDYAVINVYRFNGVGPIINYDLHLGDTVICRVKNNYKTSVQVKKMGDEQPLGKNGSKG